MSDRYGAQGMVGRLRRVVMRRPGEAMAAADPAAWHYTSAIDVAEARRAHDAFADALRAWDVEVLYLARKEGFPVAEVPVLWFNSPESKVRVVREAVQTLWDVLRIRWMQRK